MLVIQSFLPVLVTKYRAAPYAQLLQQMTSSSMQPVQHNAQDLFHDRDNRLVRIVALTSQFHDLIDSAPKSEVIATDAIWSEGPLCLRDSSFLWSDVKANKVMIWTHGEAARPWVEPSHFQNGHALDMQGRVIAASHG